MAEDRAHDPKRQPKPLVSPALMKAITETKGFDTEGAINYVQAWQDRFGKGRRSNG